MKELKVVIADDSEPIRDLLQRMVSMIEGAVLVDTAENGVEAVRSVREHHPDVLLLDISMPLKNGIEALKEIRRENKSVVIIMFTGEDSPVTRKVCCEAGANFFLAKTQIKELREILGELLRMRAAGPTANPSRGPLLQGTAKSHSAPSCG